MLVHRKPAEMSPSALDALLAVELEAVSVEEWPGCKTGVGGDSWDTDRTQRGLDAPVEAAANTATGERRMSEKKVEVAVVGVGSEARNDAVSLGNDGVKMRKTLLPACGIGCCWRPRGNLLWRVVRGRQRMNRSSVCRDNAWQVG